MEVGALTDFPTKAEAENAEDEATVAATIERLSFILILVECFAEQRNERNVLMVADATAKNGGRRMMAKHVDLSRSFGATIF